MVHTPHSYIHGGAWRDPLQTSDDIHSTLSHLSPSSIPSIAAVASLNYRLSPYPSHPTHPTTLDNSDPDRNATHPDHLHDIYSALSWLHTNYSVGKTDGFRYILSGHSCGATLALQYSLGLSPPASASTTEIAHPPSALLLTAGIYSLPTLLRTHEPPQCSEDIARIYQDIVTGAFGTNEEEWAAASPADVLARGKVSLPEGLRRMVLAWSEEDELVEREQREEMVAVLQSCGWDREGGKKVVECVDLKGGHDFVWEDGKEMAGLFGKVVRGIVEDTSSCLEAS
ncbi:alpha/beta-hydrolase [Sporormia fimetaria CBS 119925]|uniref:Kynurenine formamidase n=1 Tax=Sporormia fimetaria CBS 119925 TaxID=1340428 RepID=A0A6A6V7J2_9PLEO|nr:alpha/beta-hydrolase [Sporormia fimetaria CBS 119925]